MFFFFSSRRRHTRWPRDWSSDVCSSDLLLDSNVIIHALTFDVHAEECASFADALKDGRVRARLDPMVLHELSYAIGHRSEERRVGKECRSRWPPEHRKKKSKTSGMMERF